MQDGYKIGEYLQGEEYRTAEQIEGLLLGEDEGDNTFIILVHKEEPENFDTEYIRSPASEEWTGTPKKLAHPLEAFVALLGTSGHVFAVSWEDENGANLDLFSSPAAVEAAHPEVKDLRTRIMESVADPGEKFELDGTYYLSFRSVEGGV